MLKCRMTQHKKPCCEGKAAGMLSITCTIAHSDEWHFQILHTWLSSAAAFQFASHHFKPVVPVQAGTTLGHKNEKNLLGDLIMCEPSLASDVGINPFACITRQKCADRNSCPVTAALNLWQPCTCKLMANQKTNLQWKAQKIANEEN